MEEGSLYIIGAAYPGSVATLDKGQIPRYLFEILKNSFSIVILRQLLGVHNFTICL